MINETMTKQAREYITERKMPGGIVLFFDGNIYGWKDRLRNPECEQPGAIAIDQHGNQWMARGGDSYNGARRWVLLWCQTADAESCIKHHRLKCDPAHFRAATAGLKPYELRVNDRDFYQGDRITLEETRHSAAAMAEGAPLEYTGRKLGGIITHVLDDHQGINPGYVILSVKYPQRMVLESPPQDSATQRTIERFLREMVQEPQPLGIDRPVYQKAAKWLQSHEECLTCGKPGADWNVNNLKFCDEICERVHEAIHPQDDQ